MTDEVTWDRLTNFTGRNGYGTCSGIELMAVPADKVMLTALTSKGDTARCDITIPLEAVPALIRSLRKVLASKTTKLVEKA